jgi:hypothetical protein
LQLTVGAGVLETTTSKINHMQYLKTLCFLALAVVFISGSAFIKQNGPLEISVKELATVTAQQLGNAGDKLEVQSFTISMDNEQKDIVEFNIAGGKEPASFRKNLVKQKPGAVIFVERRQATVDGVVRKLPSRVYKVVD